MADEPHSQSQPILDMVDRTPNLEDVGVEAARQQFDAVATFIPNHEVYDELEVTVEGADGELDARVYQPGEGERPVLVYFHGGGFVVGSLDTHDNVCQKLADESGWTVVSVDYRLAPEHPFPAPLEDAYAAVEWVADNPEAVGGDGTVAVGGDSAGANLSAGVSLLARDVARDVTTDETGRTSPTSCCTTRSVARRSRSTPAARPTPRATSSSGTRWSGSTTSTSNRTSTTATSTSRRCCVRTSRGCRRRPS